jgi:DNA-binding NtrC family response regulator
MNILMVTEDSSYRLSVRNYLSAEGFQVFLSPNVRDGLRTIKTHHMDLVISDLLVKYMDAYDFCKAVRQLSDGKEIPFIFIVQYDDDIRKAKIDRLANCICLRKGGPVGELISLINKLTTPEDQGSAFAFDASVSPPDTPSAPKNIPEEIPPGEEKDHSSARILAVDDDENFRTVLLGMLSEEGYKNITSAADGNVAIELLQKESFDLILLDIIMPTVSGFGVLKFINENAIATKVIMVTAYSDLKLAVEAKKNGAADFIAKPFMRDDLFNTIKKVLNQSR